MSVTSRACRACPATSPSSLPRAGGLLRWSAARLSVCRCRSPKSTSTTRTTCCGHPREGVTRMLRAKTASVWNLSYIHGYFMASFSTARASLCRRFTDTNVYGTDCVGMWKTRYKISVDMRIFFKCTAPLHNNCTVQSAHRAPMEPPTVAATYWHTHTHTHTLVPQFAAAAPSSSSRRI